MSFIDHQNIGGLVDGKIPAGKACPFSKKCALKNENCPTKKHKKPNPFSCAAARAHALLLISDSALLRKIIIK